VSGAPGSFEPELELRDPWTLVGERVHAALLPAPTQPSVATRSEWQAEIAKQVIGFASRHPRPRRDDLVDAHSSSSERQVDRKAARVITDRAPAVGTLTMA
jgi:hypothetical protein